MLLGLTDNIIYPGVPAYALTADAIQQLSLVPSIFQVLLGPTWADVIILQRLMRAGHPQPPFVLDESEWLFDGAEEKTAATGFRQWLASGLVTLL